MPFGWLACGASMPQPSPSPVVPPRANGPPYRWLVLHINREVSHHGAEIVVLRDLWAIMIT